jgi:spermine synthase
MIHLGFLVDDRLLEYDIDELVFEERTPYQKIQIVHSKSLGNMLVLDDLQNISEADLIYTETLMGRGVEDYRDKEIVILGGGDGALLYELLKEKPKEVIMLEIDEVVMKACAKYMRSICGDVLDKMSGPNYEVSPEVGRDTSSPRLADNRGGLHQSHRPIHKRGPKV